jgi:hypothetical protein
MQAGNEARGDGPRGQEGILRTEPHRTPGEADDAAWGGIFTLLADASACQITLTQGKLFNGKQ